MRSIKLSNIIFVVLFLFSLNFFSYRDFASFIMVQKVLFVLFYIYLFLLLIIPSNRRDLSKYKSHNFILLFFVLPFFTSISSYVTHGHSIFNSLNASLLHFIFLIYFFLIIKRINPSYIYKVLTVCMLIKLGLTIVEQITYPNVPFSFRFEGYDEVTGEYMEIGQRSGIWRFLISDAYYLYMFVGFKSFFELKKKYSAKNCILFLLCCLGLYLDQTRQIMFSFVASLMIMSFFNSKNKIVYFVVIGIFGIIIFQFVDVLFGELIELTADDVGDDYSRIASYVYYFTDYHGLFSLLFGHGFGGGNDAWGNNIFYLEQTLRLFRVDIGIVGAFHLLGFIFIFIFIVYFICVHVKNWKYIDPYLQTMLVSVVINIPMVFPLYNYTVCAIEFFIGSLYYMIDKSIVENKFNKSV